MKTVDQFNDREWQDSINEEECLPAAGYSQAGPGMVVLSATTVEMALHWARLVRYADRFGWIQSDVNALAEIKAAIAASRRSDAQDGPAA